MRHLGRLLNITGDQILSTLLLAFSIYSLVKGVISLWESPPNFWWIILIVGIGFILGVMKFLGYEETDPNKAED
jgi:lipopolysaccharide export LptBFGC system permease protein LptF